MNISLTPELEKYVQEKVESELYTSASEVIRESLRLMHSYDDIQKQRLNQLNQAIEGGLSQLRSGQKIPAAKSYQRLKQKIKNAAKDHK